MDGAFRIFFPIPASKKRTQNKNRVATTASVDDVSSFLSLRRGHRWRFARTAAWSLNAQQELDPGCWWSLLPRKWQHTRRAHPFGNPPFAHYERNPFIARLVKVARGVFQRCVETTLDYSFWCYNSLGINRHILSRWLGCPITSETHGI